MKSGEKWGRWENVLFKNFGQNGRPRPFWMSENNFRSQFLPFQIDTQLFFFLKFLDKMAAGGHFGLDDNVSYRTRSITDIVVQSKMAAGGHFGLDDNVSYRTRPRYLDE